MPLRYALLLSFIVNFILGLLQVSVVLAIIAYIAAYIWTAQRWAQLEPVDDSA